MNNAEKESDEIGKIFAKKCVVYMNLYENKCSHEQ